MAVDGTIERRWGRRSKARGIYRDPVRSSDARLVKTSGRRWRKVSACSARLEAGWTSYANNHNLLPLPQQPLSSTLANRQGLRG